MIGRVYRWRGEFWMVRRRWAGRGPRNVLVERVEPVAGLVWSATGELVVRPFRGLRRP